MCYRIIRAYQFIINTYLVILVFLLLRLILQVHHTVPAANGEVHRVRFIHATFDKTGELLAASDHRGNIFIIDLESKK
jgi:hypothetical protein